MLMQANVGMVQSAIPSGVTAMPNAGELGNSIQQGLSAATDTGMGLLKSATSWAAGVMGNVSAKSGEQAQQISASDNTVVTAEPASTEQVAVTKEEEDVLNDPVADFANERFAPANMNDPEYWKALERAVSAYFSATKDKDGNTHDALGEGFFKFPV
jgi:hypothetical protein